MTYDELKNKLDALGCKTGEILADVEPDDEKTINALAFFADRIVF